MIRNFYRAAASRKRIAPPPPPPQEKMRRAADPAEIYERRRRQIFFSTRHGVDELSATCDKNTTIVVVISGPSIIFGDFAKYFKGSTMFYLPA